MAETREVTRHDVEINAKAAIEQLREMSRSAANAEEAVAKFSSFLIQNSKKWHIPIQQLREEFRLLNAELARQKKPTLFGNFGNNKIFGMEKTFTDAAQAAGRFQTASDGIVTSVNRQSKAYDDADRASRGYGRGIDFVRTALGTLAAVGIFTFLNAIQEAFSAAIKNATELETSLYRLSNAERILSKQGVEISFEGLQKGIKRIKDLVPVFSKEDIAGLVGQVAITTQALGLTEDQIISLAESIAVLNINSSQNETLQQTAQKSLSSLLTNNSKGVADLGVQMGDAALEAKGLELGFLEAGEGASELTKHEKELTKVAIILGVGKDSIDGLNDYLDTNAAKIEENKAAWNDLLTVIGQLFLPFLPILTELWEINIIAVTNTKAVVAELMVLFAAAFNVISVAISGGIKSLEDFNSTYEKSLELAKKAIGRDFFPEGAPELGPGSMFNEDFWGDSLDRTETPTSLFEGMDDAAKEDAQKLKEIVADTEEKITDIMEDARDKRLEIDQEYQRKIEDAYRDNAQKLSDIARDAARKREDALRDYNEKVEDINRDAAQKAAEAVAEARADEIQREQEFQQRLKELKEQFLFDLEDALRERDARQVLRLIRQYNMDKKNLEDRHKLEKQQAKQDLALKLQQIEQERLLKLEAARRELAEKQAEIDLWQERERQDANIALRRKLEDAREWHQRELQENAEFLRRKLQDLAQSIAKEYKLTAAGAQAIFNLLNAYFGAGGSVSNLLSGFNGQLEDAIQNIIDTTSTDGGSTGYSTEYGGSGGFGLAEGGTFIATRPTRLMVGEKGRERVSVSPLGRIGSDVGKVFSDAPGDGAEGNLNLRIGLQKGLVAEIIDASLDKVAVHIERTSREK